MSNRTKHKKKFIKKSKKLYGGKDISSFAQQQMGNYAANQALSQLPSGYKDFTKNPTSISIPKAKKITSSPSFGIWSLQAIQVMA